MRIALIMLNLILAIWLVAAAGQRLTGKGSSGPALTVKKRDPGKAPAPSAPNAPRTPLPPPSLDSQMATVIDNNIFSIERCPNAQFGRGRSGRVELTLVGTFEIGPCKGAIIKQKAAANNRFSFMSGGWGAPPEMGGGAPPAPGENTSGPNFGRRDATRARFSGGANGTPAAGQADTSYKQYVRVGETLSNGYTLAEVTRAKAVLTRGSDKMELELQEPSKNQTTTTSQANNNRRNNVFQQMQQMQGMQMMQNMQMMRMMQRTMQQQQQPQQPSGNRGGAAGNRGR